MFNIIVRKVLNIFSTTPKEVPIATWVDKYKQTTSPIILFPTEDLARESMNTSYINAIKKGTQVGRTISHDN